MEKEELTYDVYERKFMGIANLSEVIIFIIIVYCVLSGTSLVKIYTYVTKIIIRRYSRLVFGLQHLD